MPKDKDMVKQKTGSKKQKKTRNKTPRKDAVLEAAIELAIKALEPIAKPEEIGSHLGLRMDDERLGTHYFECYKPGYRGWCWSATLTRVPRGRSATVSEVALVPDKDALLAPEWVPWADRLRPSDVSEGDTLPYVPEDERLEQSAIDIDENDDADVIEEMGLSRPRVLSKKGRDLAVKRWIQAEKKSRAERGVRRRAKHSCADCGFMMRMAGSVRSMFGVCANEWSPDDGRVVALEHCCGAHSETDAQGLESKWAIAKTHMDESELEVTVRA